MGIHLWKSSMLQRFQVKLCKFTPKFTCKLFSIHFHCSGPASQHWRIPQKHLQDLVQHPKHWCRKGLESWRTHSYLPSVTMMTSWSIFMTHEQRFKNIQNVSKRGVFSHNHLQQRPNKVKKCCHAWILKFFGLFHWNRKVIRRNLWIPSSPVHHLWDVKLILQAPWWQLVLYNLKNMDLQLPSSL